MKKIPRYDSNRQLMNQYKITKGCETCGYKENPLALQFDHINPETKFRNKNGVILQPTQMARYSTALVIAEMAKCRVLCANCHIIYTHSEQRKK